MNSGDFMKQLNEDDDRRATALAALKQILSYAGLEGSLVPGDSGYDASRATFSNRDLALELHRAIATKDEAGLNAILDRWYSANLAYQPADDAGEAGKTAGLRQLRAAVDVLDESVRRFIETRPIATLEELAKRIDRSRPLGVADSRGLLR